MKVNSWMKEPPILSNRLGDKTNRRETLTREENGIREARLLKR